MKQHESTQPHPMHFRAEPAKGPAAPTSVGSRRSHRRGRLLALVLAASATVGVSAGDRLVVADAMRTRPPRTSTTAAADQGCAELWDQVLVLGVPDEAQASAAEWMGFARTGDWISGDGLTWEHLDGRMITVASPARTSRTRVTTCS